MYACMLEHPQHFDKKKRKKKENDKKEEREREKVGKLWKGYTIAH